MKNRNTFILHLSIVLIAALVAAIIAIASIYIDLFSSTAGDQAVVIDPDQFHEAMISSSGNILIGILFLACLASIVYLRITRPITDKIQQQSEIFHTLAKNAHEAIFLINSQGIIQFVNPSAATLFGYNSDELLGENVKLLMPSPHAELHDSYIKNYLATGIKKIIGTGQQLLGQKKDGSQFPVYLSVVEVKLQHTHLFAGLIMDMTTQQKLQREVLAIPAREQQRIGEELHDGVGQQLTGLSMLAQSLLNKTSAPDHDKAEHDLAEQLANGLHDALTQVRALSRGLVPVQIYADGFMISLREITENIEKQSNIPIKLKIDNTVLVFDDAVATHLYRIVQESLNNAVKHADASEIEVSLKIDDDHGVLEIKDDGIGIPINLDNSSGLGLSIMRHRCGLFNGEITINPEGHQGTRVCCRFPLNSEEG